MLIPNMLSTDSCFKALLQNFLTVCTFAASPGLEKSGPTGVCKQARCEGLHVCGRDIPESAAHLCQRPPVAHPGLLCPHRRGVRRALDTHPFVSQLLELLLDVTWNFHLPRPQVVPGSRVDDVPATRQMMTFDPQPDCTPPALWFFSASKHKLEWKTGDVADLSDDLHSSSSSCL